MAIGSTHSGAVHLIVRDGVALIAWGLAAGLVAAALACYVPARRAAAINPSELLREG